MARERILRIRLLQLSELAQSQSDLVLVSYVVTCKSEYVLKNLLASLDKFLTSAALADSSFASTDIVPSFLQNIGLVGRPKGYLRGPGARPYGLPYGAETSVLAVLVESAWF